MSEALPCGQTIAGLMGMRTQGLKLKLWLFSREASWLALGLGFWIAAFWLVLTATPHGVQDGLMDQLKPQQVTQKQVSPRAHEKVNQELKNVQEVSEQRKSNLASDLDHVRSPNRLIKGVREAHHPLLFDSEDNLERVYRDIYGESSGYTPPVLPFERINSILHQRSWNLAYEKEERRQFILKFVENLAQAGYDVVLNEDLEVVSLRPIRKPRVSLDEVLARHYP